MTHQLHDVTRLSIAHTACQSMLVTPCVGCTAIATVFLLQTPISTDAISKGHYLQSAIHDND